MAFLKTGKTNWKYILIALILAILVGGGILWWVKTQEVPFTQLPEFKKPEKVVKDDSTDWIVVRDEKEGYEFKYPKGFDFGRDLPPEVILNNKFRESMGGNPIIDKGSITINNIQYLLSISEGFAAGSTYKDYYYTTEHNGKSFTIYFPVRFATDCRTYAYPEDQTKCENFKTTLEKMIEKVVATFKFIEKDETADWKTYEWGDLKFSYPSSWNVKKDYYRTPAQEAAGEPEQEIGLTINNSIGVEGRQMSCDEPGLTKCVYANDHPIYTSSEDPEVLKIFDLIVKSIKDFGGTLR